MTTGNAPRVKRTVRSMVFILYSVVVAALLLAGLEGYLKKQAGEPPLSEGTERSIRLREHRPGSVLTMLPDEAFLREFTQNLDRRKYIVRVDENGFIMPSRLHDEPDRVLVFLGGSTTECMLVDENLRFPALVGALLSQQTGLAINSYNGGKGGNNSLHSINVLLNKVVPLDPDAVILMHNINDLVILMLEQTYWNSNPKRSPVVTVAEPTLANVIRTNLTRWVPNTLRFAGSLGRRSDGIRSVNMDEFAIKRGTAVTLDLQALLREFELNLMTFIALCQTRGISPVLMTQANRLTATPDAFITKLMAHTERDYQVSYRQFKTVYDAFNERIREVGRKNGVLVIDLEGMIPKTSDHLFDLVHFNDSGSRLAAQIISRALKPLVERAGKSGRQ